MSVPAHSERWGFSRGSGWCTTLAMRTWSQRVRRSRPGRTQRSCRQWPALGVLVWVAGCGPDPYEPPAAPDMEQLVEAYEHPSGQINPDQLEALLNEALPLHGALQLMDDFQFLSNAVDAAKQGFEVRGFDFDGDLPLVGEVSLRVICPGFEADQPPDAAANGTLDLLLPIQHGKLGPSGAGKAVGCRFNGAASALAEYIVLPGDLLDRDVVLDGPVQVHLGDALELGKSLSIKPLVQVLGRVEVEGLPPFDNVDFRIPMPGVSETSLDFLGEQLVVFSDQLKLEFGVREARGTWLCVQTDISQCIADF